MSLEGGRGRLFKNIHPLNGGKERVADGSGLKRKSHLYGPPFSQLFFFLILLISQGTDRER